MPRPNTSQTVFAPRARPHTCTPTHTPSHPVHHILVRAAAADAWTALKALAYRPTPALLAQRAGMHSAVTDFPWSRYRRLIDMGGAYGSFLAALLRRCPRSEGVLFDQPQARPRPPPRNLAACTPAPCSWPWAQYSKPQPSKLTS